MLPNINVINFSVSLCVVLKMGPECIDHDFMVCMELNDMVWRATCTKDSLQKCIMMGIKRYAARVRS